jgi:hypothetical protein
MVMNMKNSVFQDVTPCSLVEANMYLSTRRHTSEDRSLDTKYGPRD